MPFQIIQADITKLKVDAIVNAANNSLLGGGGVDGAIHKAAGPGLLAECRTLGGCETGDAKLTGGYHLPARHVIHTVGPIWQGGGHGEEKLLRSAYRRSLEVARDHDLKSVAFPLISSGIYGYPKRNAIQVAVSEITGFLDEAEMEVFLVIYDRRSFEISTELKEELSQYIRETLTLDAMQFNAPEPPRRDIEAERRGIRRPHDEESREFLSLPKASLQDIRQGSLEDLLKHVGEPFSLRLLRFIDEKGLDDVSVYKRANIDRKLFSKIRSNKDYKPSKATALAFAVALGLSIEETDDLLRSAGFALSLSSRFDVIISWFLLNKIHDIHTINAALFQFDEPTLGAS